MEHTNESILKGLLADIKQLGYRVTRSKAKFRMNLYFYIITDKLTKNQSSFIYHPDDITYRWSAKDYGYFTFSNLKIVTYYAGMLATPLDIKELLDIAHEKLIAINGVDPSDYDAYLFRCEQARKANGLQKQDETTEQWATRLLG